MMTFRILILGGTSEARELAGRLAGNHGLEVTVSLAGRTKKPAPHRTRVRLGGFGGADGLERFIGENRVDLLIDATHPFASRISANAVAAAAGAGIEAFAVCRLAWKAGPGDIWNVYPDTASAIDALGPERRRVFVALGRQELDSLRNAPHHFYLVRSVDPVEPPLPLPEVRYLVGRGPFVEDDETGLMRAHRIDFMIARNSGGSASQAKLAAARRLGIPVHLIERPGGAILPAVSNVEEAIAKVRHLAPPDAWRGA